MERNILSDHKMIRKSSIWHPFSRIFFAYLLSANFSLKASFFCDSKGNRIGVRHVSEKGTKSRKRIRTSLSTRPRQLRNSRMIQNFHLVWLDGSIDETNDDCRNSITKFAVCWWSNATLDFFHFCFFQSILYFSCFRSMDKKKWTERKGGINRRNM